MAALLHADSRRSYSWWWDSHISPKNSKWLQENLTDMDLKVKSMITLLEEDADSFARKAEMYYKKRPELMKLVEEFYRAYRALAEKYNHAIMELRQAHQTMEEAFPNQIPFKVAEDCPVGLSMMETELHTPEMPHPICSLIDLPYGLQKDAAQLSSHFYAIKRSGVFAGDDDAVTSKKGLKQLNEMFATEGQEHVAQGRIRKGFNFQEEKRKECSEHVAYVGSRDHQKHESVDKDETDSTIKGLQDEVSRLLNENKELKARVALECEHVHSAETAVESLRKALFKLQSEEEAACLQCQQCLERLSNLEAEFCHGQDEIVRLKDEILRGSMKVNDLEEQFVLLDGANQSLQSEVDTLVRRSKMQQQELMKKNEEMEKLRICIHNANLHRLQAEEALQSLQHLHSQSQEENKAFRLEVQQWSQMLKDMEVMKQGLQDEVKQITEEKLSSLVLIKNLQDEISTLKGMKGKLEEDAGLSTHKRNALQLELCYLKREIYNLNLSYQDVMEQVESVSLYATCLRSSVKDLQDENLKLKEIYQKSNEEKEALLQKVEKTETLSENNILLERSLSDTSATLGVLRETFNKLEESFQCLQNENLKLKESCWKNDDEKVALLGKLENMNKLSEKNMILERSLSDASSELEGLRTTINTIEESHLSLHGENIQLKEICHTINDEKKLLLDKLENMKKLSERNILLENSLSDTNAQLQVMRETIKSLEDSCHSLQREKLNLEEICQKNNDDYLVLLEKLENMEKVLENNMLLENSLSEASAEVQRLRENLKALQESLHSIQDKNSELKVICQKNDDEKLILSQKLGCMEKLLEKTTVLEFSLSDATSKLQGLEAKLKKLEESFQSLQEEKSNLVSEKDTLVSQVEGFTKNTEMLSKRNVLLENSLSFMNAELEELRMKSNYLEKCCQSLQDEKSSLLAIRNNLLSEVESLRLCQEDLEQKHKELQTKHSDLEQDRELTLHHVDNLQILLNRERKELASFIQSSKTEHTSLENQVHLLQEETRKRKEDLEEEKAKVMNAHVEIFILQRCIHDIIERQLSLSIECHKYVDASTQAKNMILEMKKETIWQQEKAKSLLVQINKLKMVIHQVLKVLDLSVDDGCLDRSEDQVLLQHILERIKDMQSSVLDAEDENKLLNFENCINSTVLEQLRLDVFHLERENYTLKKEAEVRRSELSMLQAENHKLLDENQQLILKEQDSIRVLENEMEKLNEQFSELQDAYQTLMVENCKSFDENASLSKKFTDLKEENRILQEENDSTLGEAMIQANLSMIFESVIAEKALVLKALSDNFNCLCGFNSHLQNEIREMVENMRMVKTENLHLKESVERLEEYKNHSLILADELNMIRNINDQQNHQNEIRKNLLSQKEVTLLQVSQELEATQCENVELHKEIVERRTLEDHLEASLLRKSNEVELRERENTELLKKIDEQMAHEGHLESELLQRINELELWGKEIVVVYEDLYVSAICASIYEEKAMEISEAYESLKGSTIIEKQRFDNERAMINSDVEELKREVTMLEGDNVGLKAEMADYLPLILSLEKSISSLEYHALSSTKVLANGNQEVQDASLATGHHNHSSSQEPGEDHGVRTAVGILELKKLQAKIQAVEKVVFETVELALQDSSNSKAKLDIAIEEMKELRSRLVPQDTESRKDVVLLSEGMELSEDCELQRIDAEASQTSYGFSMKDIQLDHVSGSLAERNVSHRMGWIQISEADDQMLELWETAEQEGNLESTRKLPESVAANEDETEFYHIEVIEEHLSSEFQEEKEMVLSNQDVSKVAKEPSEEENVRIVERPASDACRLVNLQTSVRELKKKIDKSRKRNRYTAFDYDKMKGQLKEIELAISQTVDINRKPTKNAEVCSAFGSRVGESLGGMGNACRRQVVGQVQKSSENIRKLELEVQAIQLMLLKFEDQQKSTGIRAIDKRKSVVLRDLLYGGISQGRRKVPCSACIRPPQKE